MKQTGIIKKLDELGRIVIPIKARRALGWVDNTPIEISQFKRYILLREWGDSEITPVEPRRGSPVLKELIEILSELSDEDMLLVLNLLRRLARTAEVSEDNQNT
ncbi:AbrB/MazE/SpoVT family DNA-binding domain-containing protein [Marasmitruncus massiliensis]|uniref:AbrB/MazE/SpoVT family DNA-binding domain-containing protein n=1 Tax=Marasmitruncus massiliensis TaxID=1944642 RepID=UPI000C7E7A94|nr:AbrB/MazE/SpoVT family DNA-binding domain-containing protein [Marasmitruncus massiliensis]